MIISASSRVRKAAKGLRRSSRPPIQNRRIMRGKGLSIFYVAYLSVTSRMYGQRTVAALRKALRFHAEGMVKPRSIVFPGKGCRQLH